MFGCTSLHIIEEREKSFEFILMNCLLFSGREACIGISDSYFKSRLFSYANWSLLDTDSMELGTFLKLSQAKDFDDKIEGVFFQKSHVQVTDEPPSLP